MVTFKFSSVKKTANRGKKSYSYITIVHKAEGVIKKIDDAFKVEYNGKLYGITNESYNAKGKKVIYARKRDEYNHRIKIIRDIDSKPEVNKDFYIPFAEGLIAKGRIVKSPLSPELFHITSCYSICETKVKEDNELDINYEI